MDFSGSLQVSSERRLISLDQSGRLECKSNDFLPRNFYDKVREIAETTYKSNWVEQTHPAVVDRKWKSFPISG
jgi:hypothetical protein